MADFILAAGRRCNCFLRQYPSGKSTLPLDAASNTVKQHSFGSVAEVHHGLLTEVGGIQEASPFTSGLRTMPRRKREMHLVRRDPYATTSIAACCRRWNGSSHFIRLVLSPLPIHPDLGLDLSLLRTENQGHC